jgi:hypothetical protein
MAIEALSPLTALLFVAGSAVVLSVWRARIRRRLPPTAHPRVDVAKRMMRTTRFVWGGLGLLMLIAGVIVRSGLLVVAGVLLVGCGLADHWFSGRLRS